MILNAAKRTLTTMLCAKSMNILIAILMIVLISGCSTQHDLVLDTDKSIKVWVKNHSETFLDGKEVVIEPGSEKYKKFESWLNSHRGEWSHSSASYATGDIVVTGDDFTFNFMGKGVVLNYRDQSNEAKQLVRDVFLESYDFLL